MTQALTPEAENREIKLKVAGCHVTVVKITHRETSSLSPHLHLFSD